jgi:hypothetical protein
MKHITLFLFLTIIVFVFNSCKDNDNPVKPEDKYHKSTQNIPTLSALYGAPSKSFSTGWKGTSVAGVGAWVKFGGSIGGTLAKVDLEDEACCSGSGNTGYLSFRELNGTASMNVGLETIAQYKFSLPWPFGETTGDLPFLPNYDLAWKDNKSFPPNLLNSSVKLSDTFQDIMIFGKSISWSIISAEIGITLSAGATVNVQQNYLSSDCGNCTSENDSIEVSVNGDSLVVSGIHEDLTSTTTINLTPQGSIGLSCSIVGFDYDIPIFTIPIPIDDKHYTTNSESITIKM